MNTTARVDILVVGAGPAGLTTAISASRHGAAVLLVERHAGTSIHPRAIGITTRSMEVLRTWGIDQPIRAADIGMVSLQTSGYTLTDVSGTPTPVGYPLPAESLAVSPVSPGTTPQDHLEPVLLAEAEKCGTTVLFDTELSTLRVDHRGVRAVLTNRIDGTVLQVQARYVVGADGVRSTVRRSLGIGTERLGVIGDFAQVLFRADLDDAVAGRRYFLYAIEHPDAPGAMLPAGDGRWVFALPWPDAEPAPGDVAPARWIQQLRIATGVADLEPEILSVLPFTMAADVASTFQAGRGFLVGDAAHRMTPMGGVGMNTGDPRRAQPRLEARLAGTRLGR